MSTQTTVNDRFLRDLEDNYLSSLETIKVKNQDYATNEDPFRNMRKAAEFAGIPIERAMLVRVGDKFGRFENLLSKEEFGQGGPAVLDETVEDTLRDILGYVNIMAVYRSWKRKSVEGYLFSGAEDDYILEPEDDTIEDSQAPQNAQAPTLEDLEAEAKKEEESSVVKRFRQLLRSKLEQ